MYKVFFELGCRFSSEQTIFPMPYGQTTKGVTDAGKGECCVPSVRKVGFFRIVYESWLGIGTVILI